MEADEALVPMGIGFLGVYGVSTQADGLAEAWTADPQSTG